MESTGRTAHQVDPGADRHSLADLHHLERFVEQNLARQPVVNDLDEATRTNERLHAGSGRSSAPVGQRKSSPIGIPDDGYPMPQGELEQYAPSEGVGDVVVPE
jgi:hypothetical protein